MTMWPPRLTGHSSAPGLVLLVTTNWPSALQQLRNNYRPDFLPLPWRTCEISGSNLRKSQYHRLRAPPAPAPAESLLTPHKGTQRVKEESAARSLIKPPDLLLTLIHGVNRPHTGNIQRDAIVALINWRWHERPSQSTQRSVLLLLGYYRSISTGG